MAVLGRSSNYIGPNDIFGQIEDQTDKTADSKSFIDPFTEKQNLIGS